MLLNQLSNICGTSSFSKISNLLRYASTIKINTSEYPLIRKDKNVVETLHGIQIADPYRYLEDPLNEETTNFIKKLNDISSKVFEKSNIRGIIKERLREYINYEKHDVLFKHGDYYYYSHNTGLQNHNTICRKKTLDDKEEIFLDVNKLSKDGLISCSSMKFSNDGSIMAYGLSINGSDWNTIKFKTSDNKDVDDILEKVKHSNSDFLFNNTGFIYSTYPNRKESDTGRTVTKNEYHSLYYHKMGTSQKDDVLIVDYPQDKEVFTFGSISNDEKYLFVYFNKGTDPKNMIYYYDLSKNMDKTFKGKIKLEPLFDKGDASYEIIDSNENEVIVKTDKNAPLGKIIKVKFSEAHKGESAWTVLIDELKERKISDVTVVGKDYLLLNCLENVRSSLYMYNKHTGEMIQKFDIDIGIVYQVSGDDKSNEFFFGFLNQITPGIIYRGYLDNSESNNKFKIEKIIENNSKNLNSKDFSVKQVFYKSKDNKDISMFIFHRKDMKLDGNNPVLLEGYGGFSISMTPSFSVSKSMFVKHFNGISCIANIRGGGEYGEEWHIDGMLHKKQNCFDDFIGAAEYLVSNKYTNPSKLAIRGGSNGGLLMAAVSQQRPDLFGAVINSVGVLDMLRFHKFTAGGAWIAEYGNPEIKEDFDYLLKYSPLHNLEMPPEPIQWPNTLLKTADHDDRVVPSHTLKYIATLYEVLQTGSKYQTNPVIAKIEKSSGHGSGKPLSKALDEIVDDYSFLQQVLDINWKN
ncbi:Prolyl endopeptidase [Strongyloides ratti]|uniref:Prolyl endopeptidase n=1 Tax=Strongyloides ratti TaxID=34506 RepID=A0A090MZQ4_STRRB|nr:Prolyl endopeptidase [Strongyloides ratti]CEF69339.1 Prolyl endopeptidase [Strongyloides ratti]